MKMFKCEDCGKEFKYKGHFDNHRKKHKKEPAPANESHELLDLLRKMSDRLDSLESAIRSREELEKEIKEHAGQKAVRSLNTVTNSPRVDVFNPEEEDVSMNVNGFRVVLKAKQTTNVPEPVANAFKDRQASILDNKVLQDYFRARMYDSLGNLVVDADKEDMF